MSQHRGIHLAPDEAVPRGDGVSQATPLAGRFFVRPKPPQQYILRSTTEIAGDQSNRPITTRPRCRHRGYCVGSNPARSQLSSFNSATNQTSWRKSTQPIRLQPPWWSRSLASRDSISALGHKVKLGACSGRERDAVDRDCRPGPVDRRAVRDNPPLVPPGTGVARHGGADQPANGAMSVRRCRCSRGGGRDDRSYRRLPRCSRGQPLPRPLPQRGRGACPADPPVTTFKWRRVTAESGGSSPLPS